MAKAGPGDKFTEPDIYLYKRADSNSHLSQPKTPNSHGLLVTMRRLSLVWDYTVLSR